MPSIEVCFSPLLYPSQTGQNRFTTVVIDVLRATTAFCAAFEAGVESLVPVASLEELKTFKEAGFLTAAERDGKKVDFADYGNSPLRFLQEDLRGKSLAYSTTNGTQAIEIAKPFGGIVTASFANLHAVAAFLKAQNNDLVILCSGWMNSFSLEDSVCAGALIQELVFPASYSISSDSALAALELWEKAKECLQPFCSRGSHYKRLEKLGLQDDLDHCFLMNTSSVVPAWNGEKLIRSFS
jgi:2-phosphosulfolactate phosphatase